VRVQRISVPSVVAPESARSARAAEGAIQHHVTALGAQGDLHAIGQGVDAGLQGVSRRFVEQ